MHGGFLMISKSRYQDTEGLPKTTGSERSIKLLPSVVEALQRIKPMHVTKNSFVFVNQEGHALNFHTWRGGIWYRVLKSRQGRRAQALRLHDTRLSALA